MPANRVVGRVEGPVHASHGLHRDIELGGDVLRSLFDGGAGRPPRFRRVLPAEELVADLEPREVAFGGEVVADPQEVVFRNDVGDLLGQDDVGNVDPDPFRAGVPPDGTAADVPEEVRIFRQREGEFLVEVGSGGHAAECHEHEIDLRLFRGSEVPAEVGVEILPVAAVETLRVDELAPVAPLAESLPEVVPESVPGLDCPPSAVEEEQRTPRGHVPGFREVPGERVENGDVGARVVSAVAERQVQDVGNVVAAPDDFRLRFRAGLFFQDAGAFVERQYFLRMAPGKSEPIEVDVRDRRSDGRGSRRDVERVARFEDRVEHGFGAAPA